MGGPAGVELKDKNEKNPSQIDWVEEGGVYKGEKRLAP